jgi:hypothetical protein
MKNPDVGRIETVAEYEQWKKEQQEKMDDIIFTALNRVGGMRLRMDRTVRKRIVLEAIKKTTVPGNKGRISGYRIGITRYCRCAKGENP